MDSSFSINIKILFSVIYWIRDNFPILCYLLFHPLESYPLERSCLYEFLFLPASFHSLLSRAPFPSSSCTREVSGQPRDSFNESLSQVSISIATRLWLAVDHKVFIWKLFGSGTNENQLMCRQVSFRPPATNPWPQDHVSFLLVAKGWL